MAIGGHGPHPGYIGWVTEKLFREERHDCAVEVTSSAPNRVPDVTPIEVQSDHFSYFSNRCGFEEAIAFLKDRLTQYKTWGDVVTKEVVRAEASIRFKKTDAE
jgi:hypothetical protein